MGVPPFVPLPSHLSFSFISIFSRPFARIRSPLLFRSLACLLAIPLAARPFHHRPATPLTFALFDSLNFLYGPLSPPPPTRNLKARSSLVTFRALCPPSSFCLGPYPVVSERHAFIPPIASSGGFLFLRGLACDGDRRMHDRGIIQKTGLRERRGNGLSREGGEVWFSLRKWGRLTNERGGRERSKDTREGERRRRWKEIFAPRAKGRRREGRGGDFTGGEE